MFSGFPDETIRFFLDLRFHNNAAFFHENHDRYLADVQKPFYDFIEAVSPQLRGIDPQMELRPHKCLSRIHRDTRFSKDKSPYRDHLWIAFRRAGEPKEGSVNFFFEFGPDQLGWGMGTWGENKALNDRLRTMIAADPHQVSAIVDSCDLAGKHLAVLGSFRKRLEMPEHIPERLRPWYTVRDVYICRTNPKREWVFTEQLLREVQRDWQAMAPIYKLLRGIQDDLAAEERAEEAKAKAAAPKEEW